MVFVLTCIAIALFIQSLDLWLRATVETEPEPLIEEPISAPPDWRPGPRRRLPQRP